MKDIADLGGWKWELVPFALPQDLKLEIQAIPYALAANSMDRIMWRDSPRGDFNMKSAYRLVAGLDPNPIYSGNWIWKLQSLPKIQFFLWKCSHNSIGVNECLAARGVNVDPSCPLCKKEPESILHALRDCDLVRVVWNELGALGVDRGFFASNLGDWMMTNGKLDIALNKFSPPWKIIFSFAVWNLWKNRNQAVFKRWPQNSNLVQDIINSAVEFFHCAVSTKHFQPRVTIQVRWERPDQGWMKINTDGSSLGNPGRAGGGGVIRDWTGRWIVGFSRRIGITTSLLAELWAIRDGLMLCIERNFSKVEVELDAKAVVDMLTNPQYDNMAIHAILEDCKFLVAKIPQTRIKHCYREANRCADMLARKGTELNGSLAIFANPPLDILNVVEADLRGISLDRRCPVSFVSV